MPPPAAADVLVAHLTLDTDAELDAEPDEQPVASSTAVATAANANRYGDLTSAS
jgi:hypothetical protein